MFIFRNGMDFSTQLPILNQRNNIEMGPMLLCGEDPFNPVEDNEPDSTSDNMIVVRAVPATSDDDDYPEIPPMENQVRLLDEENPEILEHMEFEL